MRGGGEGGGVGDGGGKKPKESGVKFDAEIPSQIPRRRAAVGRHAAAATVQSQHKLHNIPPTNTFTSKAREEGPHEREETLFGGVMGAWKNCYDTAFQINGSKFPQN